jgi:hypothetical protein
MALKPREPRQKVLIKARMRVGASWADACILNLSSRGMLVQSGSAPQRGNYLEIRRGRHVVVARVVWSFDERFGVETQQSVSAEDLIRETDNSSTATRPVAEERRVAPRYGEKSEARRQRGRVFEFGSLALFGIASAFLLFATVHELLGRPLSALEAALLEAQAGQH